MTASFIRVSRRFYEFSLLAYPRELRLRFGEEMSEVFVRQLRDAQERHSLADTARVWFVACLELLSVAMPGLAVKPALVIPLASLLSTAAIYHSLSWALENPLRLNSVYHSIVNGCCSR
jgi:hypothetical protein